MKGKMNRPRARPSDYLRQAQHPDLKGYIVYWCSACGFTDMIPRANLKQRGWKPSKLEGAFCASCGAPKMEVLPPIVATMCVSTILGVPQFDEVEIRQLGMAQRRGDRKSTRLNSSHSQIS